jgi:chitinase
MHPKSSALTLSCFLLASAGPASAAANIAVYGDSVASGWQAGVWNCSSYNLKAQPSGKTGTYAAQVKETCAWGGFGFDHRSADWSQIGYLQPSDFPYLSFDVRPAKAAQLGNLYVVLGVGSAKSIKPYVTQTNSAGWSHVRIPTADLTNQPFYQAYWQSSLSGGQTFYLDNVAFEGSTASNQPPTARATATPGAGVSPLAVAFDGGASSDPEGDALTYNWSFGDGSVGSGKTVNHTYVNGGASPVSYTPVLTVNDGHGGSAATNVSVTVNPAATANSNRWVSGYYVGYESTLYPADKIDFSALTHLIVGRVWPNSNGSLNTTFDMDATSGPAMAQDLAQRAHAAGRKAVLMVGGAGTNWNNEWTSATNSATRAAFIKNLVSVANQLGYDGWDLDWEENISYPQFLALVKELRAAAPNKVLTIPVGWINMNFPALDPFYGNVAPYVDQLNVMSYVMADAWGGWLSWHSSALRGAAGSYPSSVESSVNAYLAAGVPAQKLGVGTGFFGECWSAPVTGPRQAVQGGSHVVASDGEMSYANIMNQYYTAGRAFYDNAAEAAYLSATTPFGPKGCAFVSYENEQSVAAKGAYVKANHLGGTIIWTINQGYNPASSTPDSLLQAVKKAFLP